MSGPLGNMYRNSQKKHCGLMNFPLNRSKFSAQVIDLCRKLIEENKLEFFFSMQRLMRFFQHMNLIKFADIADDLNHRPSDLLIHVLARIMFDILLVINVDIPRCADRQSDRLQNKFSSDIMNLSTIYPHQQKVTLVLGDWFTDARTMSYIQYANLVDSLVRAYLKCVLFDQTQMTSTEELDIGNFF